MNWFAEKRQEWISEMLDVYGHINRSHLMRKFGVSNAQAALDFAAFKREKPGQMTYDPRRKSYVATPTT